jgi:hypothetical protein
LTAPFHEDVYLVPGQVVANLVHREGVVYRRNNVKLDLLKSEICFFLPEGGGFFFAPASFALNLMGLCGDCVPFCTPWNGTKSEKKPAASGNEVVFHGSVQVLWLIFPVREKKRYAGRIRPGAEKNQNARF